MWHILGFVFSLCGRFFSFLHRCGFPVLENSSEEEKRDLKRLTVSGTFAPSEATQSNWTSLPLVWLAAVEVTVHTVAHRDIIPLGQDDRRCFLSNDADLFRHEERMRALRKFETECCLNIN